MDEDYVLGEDMTELARSKKPANSAVLSLRVPMEMLRDLEQLADAEDRPISNVIRRMIRRGLAGQRAPQVVTTTAAPVTVTWTERRSA